MACASRSVADCSAALAAVASDLAASSVASASVAALSAVDFAAAASASLDWVSGYGDSRAYHRAQREAAVRGKVAYVEHGVAEEQRQYRK